MAWWRHMAFCSPWVQFMVHPLFSAQLSICRAPLITGRGIGSETSGLDLFPPDDLWFGSILTRQFNISKRIFFNTNIIISIHFLLKFVPTGPIDNIPALVYYLNHCWPDSLTHICCTRGRRVNWRGKERVTYGGMPFASTSCPVLDVVNIDLIWNEWCIGYCFYICPRFHRWSLGMDKYFLTILNWRRHYLSTSANGGWGWVGVGGGVGWGWGGVGGVGGGVGVGWGWGVGGGGWGWGGGGGVGWGGGDGIYVLRCVYKWFALPRFPHCIFTFWIVTPRSQGCHGQGKVWEIPVFLRVREKSGNFVGSQRIL